MSRQSLAEFAFLRPFPYGLDKKMAARTIYHAQKLLEWVHCANTQQSAKVQQGVFETLRSISRISVWAYMCASQGFGFKFDIKKYPDVYEPAEDSFLLADAAMREIEELDTGNRILDMGCGSGIVSYILIRFCKGGDGFLDITSVDINPAAIECSRKNGVPASKSDLFSKLSGQYDLIIFNPPYLPDDMGEPENEGMDKALYGGKTGRELSIRFMKDARYHITNMGSILIVVSTHTGPELMIEQSRKLGYLGVMVDKFENLSVWRLKLQ